MSAAIRSSRRWLQFSLRGLLVLLTLLGVLLGRHVERVRRQKLAVAVWNGLGAEISYRHERTRAKSGALYFDSRLAPPAPAAARRLLGDEHFQTPIRLRLVTSQKVSAEDFAALGGLPELENLEIYARIQLTDETARRLRRFGRLERLVLANLDGQSDATGISTAFLENLAEMTTLRELFLLDGAFGDAEIDKLRRALPECQIVN